jgi:hypothetical protein
MAVVILPFQRVDNWKEGRKMFHKGNKSESLGSQMGKSGAGRAGSCTFKIQERMTSGLAGEKQLS